ncbi:multidrug transporter [Treponema primitia]|uniref:multidrug transporter n=1 Tax=Treponema primitia TaxID=88058 RepID=UPI00397FA053
MDIFLQIWGGSAYLLAKILLSHAEGLRDDRIWRMAGWSMYLFGLPAWVILLAGRRNWIAAANEVGGGPSLLLGLLLAWKRLDRAPKFFDWAVRIVTYIMIVLGTVYSLYSFGGLTAFSQALEIGVTIGFLLGSFLLAGKNPAGWLFYGLMVISMGSLMFIQGKIILIIQQGVSLVFVISGFARALRRNTKIG